MIPRLALATLFITACADQHGAAVPDQLRPPAGLKPVLEVTARGVQIYVCTDGAWTLKAPEADLFDAAGRKIGRHFAGPTWQLDDGGTVVGAIKQKVDAPAADAVPWLLLEVKSAEGPGVLAGVKNVQRLDTGGGKAPAGPCPTAGEETRVPYTARYVFHG